MAYHTRKSRPKIIRIITGLVVIRTNKTISKAVCFYYYYYYYYYYLNDLIMNAYLVPLYLIRHMGLHLLQKGIRFLLINRLIQHTYHDNRDESFCMIPVSVN